MSALVDRLLRELEDEIVIPQRYSRRSWTHRSTPLAVTVVVALVALIGGVLLGEKNAR